MKIIPDSFCRAVLYSVAAAAVLVLFVVSVFRSGNSGDVGK